MRGFILGSIGGPIGALIGAGVGLIGGIHAKSEMEEQAKSDADRQKKMHEELERQVLSQREGAAAVAAEPPSPPAEQNGLILIKDHLADEQPRSATSPTRSASGPGVVVRGRAAPAGPAPTAPTAPASPPSSFQGLIVVKDHMADEQPRSGPAAGAGGSAPEAVLVEAPPAPPPERASASVPASAAGRESPAPMQPPPTARAPSEGVDSEGFRAVYEGGRLVRRERDVNGDGRADVIVYYGDDGQPLRREESSRFDGRIDTWIYYAQGRIERKESDTDGDGVVDLWAYYGPEGDLARLDSLVDPRRRVAQFYAEGKVVAEEWWREPGGQLQARLTYQDGKLVEREEDSTGSGWIDLVSLLDGAGRLLKQGRKNGDGQIVAWRYFDAGGTVLREEEIGVDGAVMAVSHYENGRLARRALYELDDRLIQRVPLLSEGEPASGG